MAYFDLQRASIVLSIACLALLLARLLLAGLSKYRFLIVFLTIELVGSVVLLPLSPVTRLYGNLFMIFGVAVWISEYLVTLELVRLTLQDYPAVAKIGRQAISWCIAIAVIVAAGFAIPAFKTSNLGHSIFMVFLVVQRTVILSLLLFLVLIQFVLLRFRVPLSRNRKIYSIGYALYFGIGLAADSILTVLGFRVAPAAGYALVAAASALLAVGAFFLNPEGEAPPKADIEIEDPAERRQRERLHRQLDELNRVLEKTAGRVR